MQVRRRFVTRLVRGRSLRRRAGRQAALALTLLPLVLVACGVGAGQQGDGDLFPLVQELRIVNWNVAGFDDKRWFPTKDEVVAALVFEKVEAIDANVVTLQEATVGMIAHLGDLLGLAWRCYAWSPGQDWLVTCVKGVGLEFSGDVLSGHGGRPPEERFWGYTQLEYRGVTITNVHTRCGDSDDDGVCDNAVEDHVPELHEIVTTGVVAGDFNHERPELPDWHQTDPDLEYTLRTKETRVDHVLTVMPFLSAWGVAEDEAFPYTEISNHRALLSGVRLETPRP